MQEDSWPHSCEIPPVIPIILAAEFNAVKRSLGIQSPRTRRTASGAKTRNNSIKLARTGETILGSRPGNRDDVSERADKDNGDPHKER